MESVLLETWEMPFPMFSREQFQNSKHRTETENKGWLP